MRREYAIATIVLCTLFLVFSGIHVARGGGLQLQSGDQLQQNIIENHKQALANDGTVCYREVQNDVSLNENDADTSVTRYVVNVENQRGAQYHEQDYDYYVAPLNSTSGVVQQSLDTGERERYASLADAPAVNPVLFEQTDVSEANLSLEGVTLYNNRVVSVYTGTRELPDRFPTTEDANKQEDHVHYKLYVDAHGRIHYMEVNEDRFGSAREETLTIYTACEQDTIRTPRTTTTP